MSVRKAAIQILHEAGKSLHAEEITELIISRGLWKTTGKTPVAPDSIEEQLEALVELSKWGL